MTAYKYATLAEYKAYIQARGTDAVVTDTSDDTIINNLLEQASRYLDGQTQRTFYPRIESQSLDLPRDRELFFDRYTDVLEVVSLTNGDSTSIAASAYNLIPYNYTPKYSLKIKEGSSVTWEADSSNNTEAVVTLTSWNGCHDKYADAWVSVGTLGGAITDTTTLAFTATAGHSIEAGRLYKVDDEMFLINTVVTNTITPFERGAFGSTAATHLISTVVYEWQNIARDACIEIANTAYHRRFGESVQSAQTVTASGIVLTPREIPQLAKEFIELYTRLE